MIKDYKFATDFVEKALKLKTQKNQYLLLICYDGN